MTNVLKGLWRLFQPIRNFLFKYPFGIWSAYVLYLKSWNKFCKMGGDATFRYISPVLSFKHDDVQSGGGHYFYQDIWALRLLGKHTPEMHYDIGSRFDGFVGQATAICPVTCIDLRPPSFKLPDFYFMQGNILKLPFETGALASLSCLHTIEHIGLGRYGDEINPNGFNQALAELQRVIEPGGLLILSMPIGKERVEFNAQRVLNPTNCIEKLDGMDLLEFSIVDEQNICKRFVNPTDFIDSTYCCGMYLFKKKHK